MAVIDALILLVTRLLGVRLLNQANREYFEGLDEAEARALTPERRAFVQGQYRSAGGLLEGLLQTPAAAPQPALPPPGRPGAAEEGRPPFHPAPTPAAPASAPRKRGRPPKRRPETPADGAARPESHP